MSRGTLKDPQASALASLRSIPVVITEPPSAVDVGDRER